MAAQGTAEKEGEDGKSASAGLQRELTKDRRDKKHKNRRKIGEKSQSTQCWRGEKLTGLNPVKKKETFNWGREGGKK